MKYWLMKTEPDEFSFSDLQKRPDQTEPWDGVRNYQARNYMRDEMRAGDKLFFYHSNCETPAIVGLAQIVGKARPDPTAFDPDDAHYDPKSEHDEPRWYLRDVHYLRALKRPISLQELKQQAAALDGFALIRRGNRLSVMPVAKAHWDYILGLE